MNPVQEKALAAAVRSTLAAVCALIERDKTEALKHARAGLKQLQRFDGTEGPHVLEAEHDE